MIELLQRPIPACVFKAGGEPADAVSRFVDGDAMARAGKVPGGGQPGRARADDGDFQSISQPSRHLYAEHPSEPGKASFPGKIAILHNTRDSTENRFGAIKQRRHPRSSAKWDAPRNPADCDAPPDSESRPPRRSWRRCPCKETAADIGPDAPAPRSAFRAASG